MARAHYYVTLKNNRWMISLDGKDHGPYQSQRDAIAAAVTAARQSHASGHDAQVLVQGEDNKFRTEWTYGNDPYPPKG